MASDTLEFEWDSGQSPDALAKQLQAFDDALEKHLKEAMQRVVLQIEKDAKLNAPVDTGWLRSSIRGIVLPVMGEVIRGVVGSNVDYAEIVHEGSAPHTITGDPLAFESGGQTVFTQSVQHPGTEPDPFLAEAVEENEDWIREQFKDAVRAAAAEVS